ncbi:MAG: hypothetical protein IIA67_00570 [Planctomycetes bacterium]|nr:hypothetical protein [Planctomycetota bacterium]
MKPDQRFQSLPKSFWASVRTIGEKLGYTVRGKGIVKVPTVEDFTGGLNSLELSPTYLVSARGEPTELGRTLLDYLAFRADVLNRYVEPRLMDASEAKRQFRRLKTSLKPSCPLPMNKQKGSKKAEAYFTCIINMLIEANAKGFGCDYDPRRLTTFTRDGIPLRTLARRVDGAFPGAVNPVAIWEIKEYYYTTTFGSRVADGIYETLLDGMELEELRQHEDVDVKHYLMVDAHYTWWDCGKSYLCRIVDMLHMGYVDEVLFGREVLDELPRIVGEWTKSIATKKGR